MTRDPIRMQWNARLLEMRKELVSERKAYGHALSQAESTALSKIICSLKDLAARADK